MNPLKGTQIRETRNTNNFQWNSTIFQDKVKWLTVGGEVTHGEKWSDSRGHLSCELSHENNQRHERQPAFLNNN